MRTNEEHQRLLEVAYVINEWAFGRPRNESLSNHVMNIAIRAFNAALNLETEDDGIY